MARGGTKDKIKQVALVLFAKDGYEATSMEQIAKGVGIKKSSLYAFIKSKELLFWELYEGLESKYLNYMQELFASSETMVADARLFFLFKRYLLFYHASGAQEDMAARDFWIRVMFFPPTSFKEKIMARSLGYEQELGKKYIEIILEGMTQGTIKKDNPEDLLISFYSLRQGLYSLMTVFMESMKIEEKEERIDKVWQNFWQGIKA